MHEYSKMLSFLGNRSSHQGKGSSQWQSETYRDVTQYFHTDLKAHYGCVNAIEFSRNESLLASGGDDRRILIWPLAETLCSVKTHTVPSKMAAEHNSNIFCLSFSATDKLLFSGGNDGCIIIHDINSLEHRDTYLCEEAIYCISADPVNDSIFIAASHEGKALIYDIRTADDPVGFAETDHPLHSVQYNPESPQYVATICSRDTAKLWDIRNTASPVIDYKYSNGPYCGMSLAFNQRGDRLLVIGRRMPPLVYDVTKPRPVHEFHHAGYYSTCTIKSCCWAGPKCEYIVTGSDNFGVYMWAVPEKPNPENYIIKSASRILKGHRSLVNQVRYNDTYSIIASSGVEKIIKAWSPYNISHTDDQAMMTLERCVYTHQEYINLILRNGHFMTHNYTNASMEEDPKMMAFFDSLVQRELEAESDSDHSEEATQRRYNYELSSTSSSTSSDSNNPSYSNHRHNKGKSAARKNKTGKSSTTSSAARKPPTSHRDLLDTSSTEDSSDDAALRSMSPFSEAFVSSMLEHHREGGTEDGPNSELTDQPRNNVTMTQLIAKRKQQDLKRSLAMTKRRMKREKRKSELGHTSRSSAGHTSRSSAPMTSRGGAAMLAIAKQTVNNELSSDSQEEEVDRRLNFTQRCAARRKQKMSRILRRIGIEQASQTQNEAGHAQTEASGSSSRLHEYMSGSLPSHQDNEIRSSLQAINNLRRSCEESQSFTECIKHSREVSTSYNHTNNTQATTSNQNMTVSKETKPEGSIPKFTQRKNKSKNKHIRKQRVSDTDEG